MLSLIACLSLAACAGAGNQDLFEASADQADQATTPPAPTTPPANTDTPKPTTPGTPADPAPTPTAKCTQEDEPNNDQKNATGFTTSICGKIDGNGDTDYASFEVPEDALSVSFKHSETGGKASYRFFLNGLQVSQSADDELRTLPGATYTVQVRGQNGDRPSYRLDVSFQ